MCKLLFIAGSCLIAFLLAGLIVFNMYDFHVSTGWFIVASQMKVVLLWLQL